jgi:hypothetical protein
MHVYTQADTPEAGSSHSLTHGVQQLLKNFPAFYGTRRFITVFTRALHWSLS